jgi:hypothetical protein
LDYLVFGWVSVHRSGKDLRNGKVCVIIVG